jgi:hypothetical protein
VQTDKLVGASDAFLVIDDTGLPKKGDHSAYSDEAGHLFRFHSGQHSDLKPASRCSPGSLF